jgi:hypothetical protein
MDLCLKRVATNRAAKRIFYTIGVVLLLWTLSVEANNSLTHRDYLLPGQAKGGFISLPSSTESGQSSKQKSATISYVAFDGSSHQLVENRGRYVNVLLPQSFEGGPFFTSDHVEELVDRLDILYALYAELLNEQPPGTGLLSIAFIPQTCGMGCGLIGARGFEIRSEASNYAAIIRELDAGRLETVLLHEMAHNFDAYSDYLHYLPDHAHAWTDMFEFFAPFRYSRISSHNEAPDDRDNSPVSSVWKKYVTEETASWQHCVRDDSCADLGLSANSLWAMLYYRVEALHGIDAILDSFEFLRDYAKSNPPPVSDEEKEGVRIMSLAVGANANIACYMESLKWPVQKKVKTEMEQRFGNSNALCADRDGDGFNAINGDCDDRDASRNISSTEIAANNIDDDCDELVDEANLDEASAGSTVDNFKQSVQTGLPFEVTGSSASPNDRDTFVFSPSQSGRTRVTLCAHDQFKGWVAALQADGSYLEATNWNSYQAKPGCSSNTFDFGGLSNAGVVVIADKSTGDYSLTTSSAIELLPDHSAFMQVSASPSGGMNLQIDDKTGLFSSLGADEIEIWISGAGIQLLKPYAPELAVELNPVTVPALRDGSSYQVRIRPRANGLPLAAFSAGHLFRYDRVAVNRQQIDDRFSGAWFDSEHDGEGFIVEVLANNRAIVYWFTYRDDGSQRWMFGVGEVQENRITVNQLMDTHGGRFGTGFNPDDVVKNTVGSLSLSFLDCSTALANYSVDNNGAHQATARLTQVYGHGCDKTTPLPGSDISGSWYDPSHDGEGFIVEQISANQAVVFWFTYDETGQQSWLFNAGTIDNNTIRIPQLLQPLGGRFGRSFNPDDISQNEWGELTLEVECSGGTASYTTQTEGYSDGSQSLVSLTRLAGSGCAD